MKIIPVKKNKKEIEQHKKNIDKVTYWIAIIVSAISVYYFFIKIVFL